MTGYRLATTDILSRFAVSCDPANRPPFHPRVSVPAIRSFLIRHEVHQYGILATKGAGYRFTSDGPRASVPRSDRFWGMKKRYFAFSP